MSKKPKSKEELNQSERILRKFLSDLEDEIKNNPSLKGKKADFRNHLVSIPSSVQRPDPKTGVPVHIITTSQVPLFYQLVNDEEFSKPDVNQTSYQPKYDDQDSKPDKTAKKDGKNGNESSKQEPTLPPAKVEVKEDDGAQSARAQEEKERQAEERKKACLEHCNADLESKLKTLAQKTPSEVEIETNVQSLFEKYNVSQICEDLKKIEKKNTRRDMLLKRAEICRMECDKAEPTNADKRSKGGSEFGSSNKESPPIFIPSEFKSIIQCDPNKLHFFLYK